MLDFYLNRLADLTPLNLWSRLKDSKFSKNVAETLFTKFLLLAVGMASSIIVARSLGPQGRGLYALAITFGAAGVQFGNFGLQSSNTYYSAQNPGLIPSLIGNTLLVCFYVGGLGAFIGWLIFANVPGISPIHGTLLFLTFFWIPFGLAYLLLQNILLGLNHVREFNKVELANRVIFTILVLSLSLTPFISPMAVFACTLFSFMACCLWMYWLLKTEINGDFHPSWNVFKNSFGYGLRVYLSTLFAFLVSRIDLILIDKYVGLKETGIFSVAMTFMDLIVLTPVAIGMILFPKLSSLKTSGEKWHFTVKVTIVSTLLTYAFAFTLILFARPIIGLLYGPNFLPAADVLFWIGIGLLPYPIYNGVGQLVSSLGMSYYYVFGWLVSVFVKIVMTLVLIHKWGYQIVGLGYLGVYGVVLLFSSLALKGYRDA